MFASLRTSPKLRPHAIPFISSQRFTQPPVFLNRVVMSSNHYSTDSSSSSSTHPPWLTSLLTDKSPAPRIYAWNPDPSSPPPRRPHDPRRIHILGIGNIGRLYAAHLARHSPPLPITLVLHRRELLDDWAANPGIEITRDGGNVVERTTEGLEVEYWTDEPPQIEGSSREIDPIHNIIIATKADAALPEADRLRRYLTPSSTVAFAQNGMSKLWPPHGEAYTSHRWPAGDAPSFAACITTHGLYSLGPFRSVFASPADAKVGLVLPSPQAARGSEYLIDRIATAPGLGMKRVSRADLWVLQLEKLVVNSTINPITAVLRCRNDVCIQGEPSVMPRVMDRLLQEASAVLRALVNDPSTASILTSSESDARSTSASSSIGGEENLEEMRARLTERFAFSSLKAMYYRVMQQVLENYSSMYQDVTAGKRTEIRAFNGWLVDMAHFLAESSSPSQSQSQQGQVGGSLDVSAHQTLIDLIESGRTLDQAELGRAILSP